MLTDPDQGDTTVATMQGWTLTHKPGLRMHFVVSGVTRCARTKKAFSSRCAPTPGSGPGTQPLPEWVVAHTGKKEHSH